MRRTYHRAAIHQPNLFPRLSTLAKLYACDLWIVLDDVQFTRHDYQHRTRLIDGADGSDRWLTLPVHLPHGRGTRLRDVTIVDPQLSSQRLTSVLHQHYARSPHWSALRPRVAAVAALTAKTDSIVEVAVESTTQLLRAVGWNGDIVHASAFATRPERSEHLADLLVATDARVYVCGPGGRRYLRPEPFADAGIEVDYFSAPVGPDSDVWQRSNRVSAVDALTRHGGEHLALRLAAEAAGPVADIAPQPAALVGRSPKP
jgi:hypothetical protein